MVELVLERTGPGRHDDTPAREQGRHQIRKSLASTGAGFHDQRLTIRERGRNLARHRSLPGARGVAGKRPGKRTVRSEYIVEVHVAVQPSVARKRSSAVAPAASGRFSSQRTCV